MFKTDEEVKSAILTHGGKKLVKGQGGK